MQTLIFIVAMSIFTLGAMPEANKKLDDLVAGWPTNDPGALRMRISSEPIVQAMVLWDETGKRVFPPETGLTFSSETKILSDIDRLNGLRGGAAQPSWDILAKGSASYYRCRETRCLLISGPELASAMGRAPDDHEFLISEPEFPYIGIGLSTILAVFFAVRFKLARPQRQTQGAPAVDPDSFAFGPVTVNPRHMTVSDGSGTRDLTKRDLTLISLFAESPNFVFSKDQLYDAGWGRDYHANSRALDQYMLMLRRKIAPDQSHDSVIETVHGRGYRYNA